MPYVRGVREYKYYNDEDLDEHLSMEDLKTFRLRQVPVFNPAFTIAPVEEALKKLPKDLVDVEDTKSKEVTAFSGSDTDKEPQEFFAEDEFQLSNITVALEGVGVVDFPLSEETIQKLIDLSSKIKTSDNTDEVVEAKNQDVFLIPASELKVNLNEGAFNSMLKKISCSLNIDSQCVLQPEMRSLSVHTPAQFLGWQKSADEDSHKLVRLEIVLPSSCDKGELCIKHGGHKHKAFSSSSTPQWVAFYADCTRREMGHRVVLQYDLELQYPESLEPWVVTGDVDESLNNAVDDHFSSKNRLIVLLRHRYTEDTLAWQKTKGRDRTYACALLTVARKQGLRTFLALGTCLETWETSGYHGPIRNGGNLDLSLWVDEAGHSTSEGVTVDYEGMAREVCSLGGELWGQAEPDREVRLGWYGEGAAIREQWYHKACVVLTKEENQNKRHACA